MTVAPENRPDHLVIFGSDPGIGTIEASFGFHIIASIVSKSDTVHFGPGEKTLFWLESKTKQWMIIEERTLR